MFDNLGTNRRLNDDNLLSANTRHNWVTDEARAQTGAVDHAYTSFEQYQDDCYLSAARVNAGADMTGHWRSLKIGCRQLLVKLAQRVVHPPH